MVLLLRILVPLLVGQMPKTKTADSWAQQVMHFALGVTSESCTTQNTNTYSDSLVSGIGHAARMELSTVQPANVHAAGRNT